LGYRGILPRVDPRKSKFLGKISTTTEEAEEKAPD